MKLLNPFTAGALCDSSSYLAKGMTQAVQEKGKLKIIELGPGNGIFTKEFSKIAPVKCIELNPTFEGVLKPYAEVVIDDVFHYLDTCKFEDNVIFASGLPHIMFGEPLFKNLIKAVRKNLNPGGYLVLFTYWRWTIEKWVNDEKLFEVEKSKYVFCNVPPAWVMTLKAI